MGVKGGGDGGVGRLEDEIAVEAKNNTVSFNFMAENDVSSLGDKHGLPGGGDFVWRQATLNDGPEILAWMGDFYAEERLEFDGATQGRALDALLADPALGAVFLLGADGEDGEAAGYVVLTRGHSLEFGGRFYLLDELYVSPERRGRGLGEAAVRRAADWARAQGAGALRLEVARGNVRARALYARAGLVAEARELMTLRLG